MTKRKMVNTTKAPVRGEAVSKAIGKLVGVVALDPTTENIAAMREAMRRSIHEDTRRGAVVMTDDDIAQYCRLVEDAFAQSQPRDGQHRNEVQL